MRELTKSMMSFSWAMSLLGVRQMSCMLMPQSWGSTSSSLDSVTRCTEGQLGSVTQSLFRSGDNLQRGMVDLMFNMLTLGGWNGGGNALRQSMQWGADVMQRTAQAGVKMAQQTMSAGGPASPPTSPPGEPGWGPMPGGG